MQFEQFKGLGLLFQQLGKEAAEAATPALTPAGVVINSERTIVINTQTLNLDAAALNRLFEAMPQ